MHESVDVPGSVAEVVPEFVVEIPPSFLAMSVSFTGGGEVVIDREVEAF